MLVAYYTPGDSWETVAAEKRAKLSAAIPQPWRVPSDVLISAGRTQTLSGDFIESLLDTTARQITGLDTSTLLRMIANAALSSRQVVEAYCQRTAIASQLNNCVVEICFDSALQRADRLDQYLKATGKTFGPLHGLPVTMKDQFHVQGQETAMGYIGWLGTQGGQITAGFSLESELVRALQMLGAVVIAKTSNAQTLWCGETNNNIIGYCKNPCKQSLSSGGSSGGQAALQALGGSPIGFGTDIGGSVSMPAAFQGLYSIKPSSGRISYKDAVNSSAGQPLIDSVVGIMGGNILDLDMTLQALLSTSPWLRDSAVLAMPYRTDIARAVRKRANQGLLTFGVLEDDGEVLPHPPIQRALRLIKHALEKRSHRLFCWNPPAHKQAGVLHQLVTNADGASDIFERLKLSGEPLIPELKQEFGSSPALSMTLVHFYELRMSLQQYRDQYNDYWTSTASTTFARLPVDAVIMPVATTCAVLPGQHYHYDYTTLASTLDYPSAVIPITKAIATVDKFPEDYQPRNETEKKSFLSYDPQCYDGAPVGLQILTRRHEEEKLLAITQIIVDALQESDAEG